MNATVRTTGILLIVAPIVFALGFLGLRASFDFPTVLRQPAGDVLIRFAEAAPDLHVYWYAMMAASLALMPASIGAGLLLWQRGGFVAALSIGAGVLAGLMQALALLHWVILVPDLAATFVAPGTGETERAVAASLFDAANQYLGRGVGEHFGYLFTAGWSFFIAALMWPRHRYVAVAGLLIGLGLLVGALEPFGVPFTGAIHSISYSLWALWTLILGALILRDGAQAAGAEGLS